MDVSCLCLSDRKVFLLNTTSVRLRDACPNESGMKVAQNLLRQDYEALGNCVPPEANSYAIRLTYNPIKICKNNDTPPYFWGRIDDDQPCVDGQPLSLPSVQDRKGCHLATIIPGSSGRIFNETNLTRCIVSQPYICQLENNQSFPLCTSLKEIKLTTTATTTTAVAATTTIQNNVTVIAVGSVLGVLALALILFLIYLCCNRDETKRNTDKSDEHENYHK